MNWLEAISEMRKGNIVYRILSDGKKVYYKVTGRYMYMSVQTSDKGTWAHTTMFMEDQEATWYVWDQWKEIPWYEAVEILLKDPFESVQFQSDSGNWIRAAAVNDTKCQFCASRKWRMKVED